jgi:hypothetical protein
MKTAMTNYLGLNKVNNILYLGNKPTADGYCAIVANKIGSTPAIIFDSGEWKLSSDGVSYDVVVSGSNLDGYYNKDDVDYILFDGYYGKQDISTILGDYYDKEEIGNILDGYTGGSGSNNYNLEFEPFYVGKGSIYEISSKDNKTRKERMFQHLENAKNDKKTKNSSFSFYLSSFSFILFAYIFKIFSLFLK